MKEISKKNLKRELKFLRKKGWTCKNNSDSFNVRISAYDPTNGYWDNNEIEKRKEKSILFGESKNVQRYINLIN